MGNNIKIQSRFKDYFVNFTNDFEQAHLLSKQKDTFFVIDRVVFDLYQNELPKIHEERLFLLDAVEEQKNMKLVLRLMLLERKYI